MTVRLSDTENVSNSVSLTKIDGKAFTPIEIADSNYTQQGEPDQEGIKIATKESFKIDGTEWNVFHTTRKAVVSKLKSLRTEIAAGDLGLMKCNKTTFQNGKSGFVLVDA